MAINKVEEAARDLVGSVIVDYITAFKSQSFTTEQIPKTLKK